MILTESECPAYFQQYLASVGEDVLSEMEAQLNAGISFFSSIPEEKLYFRYAKGKWSVKEVMGHIADTERILAHRAFRIARHDKTPLPPFDENAYVMAAGFDSFSFAQLLNNIEAVRRNSIALFNSLKKDDLVQVGIASDKKVSVRALFYFIVGHFRHHENLIRERYLVY